MGFLRSVLEPQAGATPAPSSWASFWNVELQNSKKTVSGERISPEGALSISAYYACLRVLGEDESKLPFKIHETQERGKLDRRNHPAWSILNYQPNPEMTALAFRETLTMQAAGWGNGYAEIVRTGRGDVAEMHPIHPSRVEVKRIDGKLAYLVRVDDIGSMKTVSFDPEDIFHIHGPGGDGITGYSLARLAAESLGISMASEKFAGSFFGNGMNVGGTLTYPGKLSPEAKQRLRESWDKMHGGAESGNKIAVLEEGLAYAKVGIPPDEAQFLESRQFSVEDICRWCRVAPHKVQHLLRSTFSNIEQQSLEHVGDTMMPWLLRWEQEVDRKLLRGPDLYSKHVVAGLLRSDQTARANYFRTRFYLGSLSPNDIRRLEDEDPIDDEGADEYYVQSNLIPLSRVNEEPPAPAQPAAMPGAQPPPPGQGEEEQDDEDAIAAQVHALGPVLLDASRRVVTREAKALAAVLPKKPLHSPALGEWAERFFADPGYVVDAFAAAAGALASQISAIKGGGSPSDLAGAVTETAAEHCRRTALEILGGYQINVDAATERLAEAMTGAVLRACGEDPDGHR